MTPPAPEPRDTTRPPAPGPKSAGGAPGSGPRGAGESAVLGTEGAAAGADEGLAAAQEALVRALVAGGPLPAGFDPVAVGAAARALLGKRAGEVGRAWPELARGYGDGWRGAFAGWARGRVPRGAVRDGLDFARAHAAELPPAARRELAVHEARWSYEGAEPRPRRAALRRLPGGVAANVLGRVQIFARRAG